jgi:hypothetical protein
MPEVNMSLDGSCLQRSQVKIKTVLLVTCAAFLSAGLANFAWSQTNVVTYHYDNARTGQDVNETLLTPANVNKNTFGFRFSQPVDGYIVGQPLYVANVSIPGAGTHNVVYVATLNDSVYAFDADNNVGSNAVPLWHVNFTDPPSITTASGSYLPCQAVTGYTQSGVVSTPVIDPTSGTMYVVAKTNEDGTVYHRLHALDITNGVEEYGTPVAIGGSVTTQNGTVVTLDNLHEMNRPALLLNNGIVYIAFGSNGCNDSSYGWVLAYDETTLAPAGIFNADPEKGEASIWHSGNGPAADANGYIYVATAEGNFNANTDGENFGSSILKLSQSNDTLMLEDYFTPYNQEIISEDDLDLSACGVLVLPEQSGSNPDMLVASGKQGTVYMLDRDNMGHYNPTGDVQIPQELTKAVGPMFSSPAYWNNTVYFSGDGNPIAAYSLNNGLLQTPPVDSVKMPGSHAPTISANGNANGIFWVLTGTQMWAFNAVTLQSLYNTGQAGTRDTLPPQPHFSTQMVANGKVYVGTQTNLMVYGLLPVLSAASGNNQSATVKTTLPLPLQVQLVDPYTGEGVSGVTIAFSDGDKNGIFGTPNAVTDSNGNASTTYTFGADAETVTITASNASIVGTTFGETATPSAPKWVVVVSGQNQSAPPATNLPNPIVTKVADQYGNGISGQSITFSDGGAGGQFSSNPVITDSTGKASVVYTTPPTAGAVTITATSDSLTPLKITETVQ